MLASLPGPRPGPGREAGTEHEGRPAAHELRSPRFEGAALSAPCRCPEESRCGKHRYADTYLFAVQLCQAKGALKPFLQKRFGLMIFRERGRKPDLPRSGAPLTQRYRGPRMPAGDQRRDDRASDAGHDVSPGPYRAPAPGTGEARCGSGWPRSEGAVVRVVPTMTMSCPYRERRSAVVKK